MNALVLRGANCKNCYKCIRKCPVKAIAFSRDRAVIMGEQCVLCGQCAAVCPQGARYIKSDVERVMKYVERGDKVYASLDPAYAAAFSGAGLAKVSAALKALGFKHVEEAAVGADRVAREYEKLIRRHDSDNIITSACQSLNMLIARHYPDLLDQLAPVLSPMAAHAKMMRELFGPRVRIVYVGPCPAKWNESANGADKCDVDAVISFEEISKLMSERGLDFSGHDGEARAVSNTTPRFFAVSGGIIRNLSRDLRRENAYDCEAVDGLERCMEVLNAIRRGEIKGFFLELYACTDGCVGSPEMKRMGVNFCNAKRDMVSSVRDHTAELRAITEGMQTDISKTYSDMSDQKEKFSEDQIAAVLARMGKTAPEHELNCACCGYTTCREKAEAVLIGKAETRMCVPYMRERAESVANLVSEHTPNAVITLDDELRIKEINPAARKYLRCERKDPEGLPISRLLPEIDLPRADIPANILTNAKVRYDSLGITVEQSFVPIPEHHLNLLIMHDITSEDAINRALMQERAKSAQIAQDAIDRQMQAAQNIAAILGESVAETKSALTKLKLSILSDMENPKGQDEKTRRE